MAERRTRTTANDRRAISERTAKALRMQATRLHVFRERPAGIRTLQPHEWAGFDVERSEDEDGDDSESTQVYELGGVPEGVRLGHNLYEAYEPMLGAVPDIMSASSSFANGPLPTERVTSPRPPSPPPRALRGSGASLTRQSSIRRPPRTRTLDFNDFTTRRRHVHRSNSEQAASGEMLRSEDSTDGTWRFSSAERLRLAGSPVYLGPRRFFPLAAWADPYARGDSVTGAEVGESRDTVLENQSYSESPYPHHPYSPRADLASAAPGRSIVPPRLRRGGLRAPESLLPLASTSAGLNLPGDGPVQSTVSTPDDGTPTPTYRPLPLRQEEQGPGYTENEGGAHQLLTPRSISPEAEVNQ